MSEKKPTPIIVAGKNRTCPVCGQRSYSLGGIHPQCAVLQADAPRTLRLAAARKAAVQVKTEQAGVTAQARLWEKVCPRCGTRVPARKEVCECGHAFVAK